jgi:hypothetical protein
LGCTATDGSCVLLFTATDEAGNVNNTETLSITVDDVAPTVTVTFPSNNAILSQSSINITGTAADTNTGSAGDVVINDSNFGTNTGDFANWNFTNTSMVDDTYSVLITATDQAGNSGTDNVTFSVDTSIPQITIQSPTNNTLATGDLDYNITASESLDTSLVSIDGGTNMTMNNDTATHYYNLSGTHSGLSDGQHNATFWVNDSAGNSNQTTVWFGVDASNPNVSNPQSNVSVLKSSVSVRINVTMTDANPDTVLVGNGTNQTMTGIGGNVYEINATPSGLGCSEGSCILTFYANDTAGNVNDTESITITVDDTAPAVSGQGVNVSLVRSIDSIRINVTVTDSNVITGVNVSNVSNVSMTNVGGDVYEVNTTASALGCIGMHSN